MPNTWELLIKGLLNNKKKTFLLLLTLIVGITYLIWRFFFVMSWSYDAGSVIWGVILYVADFYGFVTFLIFSFETLNPIDLKDYGLVTDPTREYNPTVDIFICTYNEDPDIVRKTAIGCTFINYDNKKIYILDDGKRESIKQLADELNINYISRDKNEHYKAGNINNAIKLTNGDLIVNFDADHVPTECFLEILVPYFQDAKVGLIQTPQHFFNPDPFQRNLEFGKYVSNEQDLFFRVVQPGLSYWNATICCGTNWIARRSSIEEVGGIPIDTIVEDMATSIKLQEHGYRTLYLNKPVAAGLSAENLSEYINQRQRWAIGALQILFSPHTPLLSKKLSIGQRICYLGALNYYFLGLPRLIYLLAPSVYILLNYYGSIATIQQLIIFQIPYLLVLTISFFYISFGRRIPFVTDTYETAIAYDLTLVTLTSMLWPGKRSGFRVTQKNLLFDRTYFDIWSVTPEIVLLTVLLISLLLIPYYAYYNIRQDEALLINTFWLVYNIAVVIVTMKVGLQKPQRRRYSRLRVERSFELDVGFRKYLAITLNVSEGGALVEVRNLNFQLEKDQEVALKFFDRYRNMSVDAKIVEHSKIFDKSYLRLSFTNDDKEKERTLIKQMYSFCRRWE